MQKKNRKKIAIDPDSVDDKDDSNKKRKIPALVMCYLPVIDHLKCVFYIPMDAELEC
jgi:hypothetical protein